MPTAVINYTIQPVFSARSNFSFFRGGGVRVIGQVTVVSNSLILGGWVKKVLKNGDKEVGGSKGGLQQYFDFFVLLYSTKNATFLYIFKRICVFI